MKIKDIDKNFSRLKSISEPDILLANVKNKPFEIYGLLTSNPDGAEYRRVPKDIAEKVSPEVAKLAANTAGGRVRFSTNSEYIAIRAKYDDFSLLSNMTLIASNGFDLYQTVNGKDTFIRAFAPPTEMLFNGAKEYEDIIYVNNPNEEMLSYTIHFPLYHDVRSLEIGVKSNADIDRGVSYINSKPVVYYGSSITQGGCASHPGNSYENIISSLTNTNHVNLGFSGSARGEKEIAEYIASLDMSVFVCDYDYNATSSIELKERHEPFFKIIRQAHPDIPIILISNPNPSYSPKEERRRATILETYNNALAAGDKNVYFIDGEKFFPKEFFGCYTVDSVHPNDAGFIHMANRIGKDVAKALNIDWPY